MLKLSGTWGERRRVRGFPVYYPFYSILYNPFPSNSIAELNLSPCDSSRCVLSSLDCVIMALTPDLRPEPEEDPGNGQHYQGEESQ